MSEIIPIDSPLTSKAGPFTHPKKPSIIIPQCSPPVLQPSVQVNSSVANLNYQPMHTPYSYGYITTDVTPQIVITSDSISPLYNSKTTNRDEPTPAVQFNPPSIAITPDMIAVGELLSTMKHTLQTIGTTLDALGEQTAHVAALGPAMAAARQIEQLRTQLAEQFTRQEARIQEIQATLLHMVAAQPVEPARCEAHPSEQQVRQRSPYKCPLDMPCDTLNPTFNAVAAPIAKKTPFRLFLRPLPTPEQSPCVACFSRPFSPITVPSTPSVPEPPAPTPIISLRKDLQPDVMSSAASQRFPSDLATLFELESETDNIWVRGYGLARIAQDDEARYDNDHSKEELTPTSDVKAVPNPTTYLSTEGQAQTPTSAYPDATVDALRQGNMLQFMPHLGVCTLDEECM